MIMLEEGEIDEEDLDMGQAPTEPKSPDDEAQSPSEQQQQQQQQHHHHHHHVKSNKTGGVKRNKNKNSSSANGKPNNKRNKKSLMNTLDDGADDSGGESADNDANLDRDERFMPAMSLWSTPASKNDHKSHGGLSLNQLITGNGASSGGPVSLLDLIAKSDSTSTQPSSYLTNPVITEKENKPKAAAKIPGLFSNDLTTGGMPSLMGTAVSNKKHHDAELKRKILNSEPDESEMTISVESLEKKMEKKRKYAELFKEKQAKELEKPEPQQSNIGKVPCHFFLEGRCSKGDKCPFAHVPQRKMELCKYYGGGYCAKGDKCFYMHSDFPCKFYHRMNKCMHGDKCRFSHEPITNPQLKEAFDKYLAQDNTVNADQVASGAPQTNAGGIGLMTKMTSLLGSPPHHLASAVGESIPSLMNLAVKPQQPTKTPLIATPPSTTTLLPLPTSASIPSLLEKNFLSNKTANLTSSKTNENMNDALRVMSEFRDVDERVAPVPRVTTMPLSGDIDERSLISKPAQAPVQSSHETIKKELIKLIMKALADDDGGIFSKIPKQPLTELLIKILNTNESNNELSTDTLLTLLTTLTAASSSSSSSSVTPVQSQLQLQPQPLQSQLSYSNEENSQLTINLNDSTPDLLQIDLNSSRATSTVPVKQPHSISATKPLKINSDYEDDYEYDEYDEGDLVIEGNVGEFPFRLIEIDIEPSKLWSNPPREASLNLSDADSGDQECDPRIKYYSNRANCTNVANFHLQLQQKEQQLSFNNTPLSPTSQLQQKQLDTTASSPVNHSGTNGETSSKAQSKSANRSLDPRLVSRNTAAGSVNNNISPTRSVSPPNDLMSLQAKPVSGNSSLLSSLPEIQFPKNLNQVPIQSNPVAVSSLFQSTPQTAADSLSTVKLSIEDYKRKLQKPATSNISNGLSSVLSSIQSESTSNASSSTLSSSSSSSSLPSIPSYAINLQAPQSLHELLRNFQS